MTKAFTPTRILTLYQQHSSDLIFIKDKELNFIDCNLNFAKFAGFNSVSDIIGKSDFDMSWKPFAKQFRADDRNVLAGKTLNRLELNLSLFDTPTCIHVTKSPIYEENNIIGLIGVAKILNNHFHLSNQPNSLYSFNDLVNVNDEEIKQYFFNLTPSEAACLFFYIRGYSDSEIANQLSRSKRTVQTHLENIKNKMQCQNKSELILKAFQVGFTRIIPNLVTNLTKR